MNTLLVHAVRAAAVPTRFVALNDTQLERRAMRMKELLLQAEDASEGVPRCDYQNLLIQYQLCSSVLSASKAASRASQRPYRRLAAA